MNGGKRGKHISPQSALRKNLGLSSGEPIPLTLLHHIKNYRVGSKIEFQGKEIAITKILKKRVKDALGKR